jgi:hypothetical protein
LCKADPCAGVVCDQPPSPCHLPAGACTNGTCSYTEAPKGAECDDGDACTESDRCDETGTCVGTSVASAECGEVGGAAGKGGGVGKGGAAGKGDAGDGGSGLVIGGSAGSGTAGTASVDDEPLPAANACGCVVPGGDQEQPGTPARGALAALALGFVAALRRRRSSSR